MFNTFSIMYSSNLPLCLEGARMVLVEPVSLPSSESVAGMD